eukprot:3857820-Alexandrium_andersonii.AAC.1
MDEATPSFVIPRKALFQANSEGVQLQGSKCQQYGAWRFLYGAPGSFARTASTCLTLSHTTACGSTQNMMALNIGNSPTFES